MWNQKLILFFLFERSLSFIFYQSVYDEYHLWGKLCTAEATEGDIIDLI